MKRRMTPVPPAEPAEWYGFSTPCRYCRAKVENRIESGDVAFIRVAHEDGCKSEPEPAQELKREGDRRGRAADDGSRKARTDGRPRAARKE